MVSIFIWAVAVACCFVFCLPVLVCSGKLVMLLGGTFYQVIAPFLLPLFLAAVLSVICRPLNDYFLKRTCGRNAWAAGLTTTAVAAMVVGPIVIGTFIAAVQFYNLADRTLGGDWRRGINRLGYNFPRALADGPLFRTPVSLLHPT